ncbi:hypothetical protein PENFLA_c057G02858 [Penicillium flavigenum]|uniref:Uncharacterized protein n=1 Tax=Penicillium flavigenum TaxID=254877 RepID=A0A1V6SGU8_9EURO|nr:hypothetical protein PENFLA_c057G02858 [Penicillium flavigenum]
MSGFGRAKLDNGQVFMLEILRSVELPEERRAEPSGGPSKATPEGNFAIVRHYQREAIKSKPQFNPEAFDTPIAAQTRAKTGHELDKEMARLRLDPFVTSTRQKSHSSSIRELVPLEDMTPSRSSGPSPTPGPSPPNTISQELDKILYPPTKEEQIVNTALIVFLNALTTTHFDFYSNWTLHRKPFIATFENAQFQARTDCYLDSPDDKTRLLL